MINVLYILNSTDPVGGATKAIKNLISTFDRKEINGSFIVPDTNGIYPQLQKDGYKVYALSYRPSIYPPVRQGIDVLLFLPRLLFRLLINFIVIFKTTHIIRQNDIDIVHTNTGVNTFGWWGARLTHKPHIWHIREYGDLDFHFHFFPSLHVHKWLVAHSNTICITKGIQQHFGLTNHVLSQVIYDGVLHETDKRPVIEKSDYLLYAGRIEPAKGLEDLLHALSQSEYFTHNNLFTLKIAGKGNNPIYNQHITDLASSLFANKKIEFLGERTDVLDLMQHAKAVIIPSRSEGFGFVMPEAQFMGSMVIAHDTGGLHEQLENGTAMAGDTIGWGYTTEDELAQFINAICSNPIDTAIILRGQQVAVSLYSAERHSQQVIKLYQRVLQQ